MLDIAQLKAQIRAILLALGRGTTEREFRKEYYEIEGKSFNEVLRELGFFSAEAFLLKIPDVCRVTRNFEGELFIQRVSCEDTAHMDHLTIVKKKKRKARPTFRPPVRRFAPPAHFHTFNPYPQTAQRTFPTTAYAYPSRPIVAASRYNQRPQQSSFAKTSSNALRPANYQTNPVHHRPSLMSQKVPIKAPPPPPVWKHSVLGSEKVVYKTNERVVFDGNASLVQVKQSNNWTDAESVAENEIISVKSSSTLSSSTASNGRSSEVVMVESSPERREIQYSRFVESSPEKKLVRKEPQRVVSYDQKSDAKITIAINQSPPPSPLRKKSPKELREEIMNLRKRFVELEIGVHKRQLKDFILSPDRTLPQPQMVESPRFFAIKILSVQSPDKFTFQYDFERLEHLQKNMKVFYESVGTDEYLARNMAVDLVVAVTHKEKWFRAQVKTFDDLTAEVIPIDCMTLKPKRVDRSKIFYLRDKFANEPQKSVVGKIFGVLPAGDQWCPETVELMNNLKAGRQQATVKEFKDGIYSLSIVLDEQSRLRIIEKLSELDLVKLDKESFLGPAKAVCLSLK